MILIDPNLVTPDERAEKLTWNLLLIAGIREEDFGNYSCRAVNSLGRDHGHIVLSGSTVTQYNRGNRTREIDTLTTGI